MYIDNETMCAISTGIAFLLGIFVGVVI